MSEEKIIKHSKTAVDVALSKEKTWRKKILELTEEVAIIIFAVCITLAFHNWNDLCNERKMERDFLTGIKEDLKIEVVHLDTAVDRLNWTAKYYDTVWQQINRNHVNTAYVDSNSNELITTTFFVFNNGRFESFKSSGYLRLIENQQLLKDLTALYNVYMPFLEKADEIVYEKRASDYNTYIGVKAPVDSNKVVHISMFLNDPAVRHQIVYYGLLIHERIKYKKELVVRIGGIIAEIDQELNK
jgi:hypothetical protein